MPPVKPARFVALSVIVPVVGLELVMFDALTIAPALGMLVRSVNGFGSAPVGNVPVTEKLVMPLTGPPKVTVPPVAIWKLVPPVMELPKVIALAADWT